MRGSNYRALTGKNFGVWDRWSLIGGGRLQEVVAHGHLHMEVRLYSFRLLNPRFR